MCNKFIGVYTRFAFLTYVLSQWNLFVRKEDTIYCIHTKILLYLYNAFEINK